MQNVLTPELAPGTRWACTGRRHRGLQVQIIDVRSLSVRVRPIGSWSRQQRNNRWLIRFDKFLTTYRHVPTTSIQKKGPRHELSQLDTSDRPNQN
jgi:hypothetical protein